MLQVAPRFDFMLPSGLWLAMNEAARTKLAAFPVSISRIGFGSEGAEDWIGLDAAVDFGRGIGPAASVKGLRVYYGGPPGTHLRFDGIELKLQRPGFDFRGFVSMITGADPRASPIRRTASSVATSRSRSPARSGSSSSSVYSGRKAARDSVRRLDAEFGGDRSSVGLMVRGGCSPA